MRYGALGRLALASTVLLSAGACDAGDGRPTPRDRAAGESYGAALAELAEYEGIALVFTLQSTPEDLAKLDEGDEVLDPRTAQEILDSSVTIGSHRGTTEMVVDVGGIEDAVELRVAGGTLFVRADVRELFETFGGDPDRLGVALDRGSRAGLGFLAPAVGGGWLGIPGVDRLAAQVGVGRFPAPAGDRTVAERLAAILRPRSAVTSHGTDEIGDHVSIRLPMRKTAQDFGAVLEQLVGFPAGTVPLPDTSGLPEDDMALDAWVKDGRLVQLELDLLGIGDLVGEEPPEGVSRYALRMRLEELTSDVVPPRDATLVAPRLLLEALVAGFARAL